MIAIYCTDDNHIAFVEDTPTNRILLARVNTETYESLEDFPYCEELDKLIKTVETVDRSKVRDCTGMFIYTQSW